MSHDAMVGAREAESTGMHERRRVPRLRSLLSGIIVFDAKGAMAKGTTMDCAVRNISAYGAKVVLADAFRLPEAFNLRVPHHDQVHRAEVVWRKGDAAGLQLSDVVEIARHERHHMSPRAMKRAHQKEMDASLF